MKQALSICYLVFFVIITAISTSNYLQLDGYPLWMTISGVAIPAVGAVSMLLYTFSYKPESRSWFWKIVPLMLVAYYAVEWCFDFVLYPRQDYNPQLIGVATFVGLLLLFPLLYSSFKFGYSNNDI